MPPSNVAIDLKAFPPLPSAGAKPTRMTASKHVPASDQTDSDTKTASANTTTAEHADTKTEALLKPRIFNGAPLEKILKVVARYQHGLRTEPEHPHRLAMLKAIEQGFGIAMMAVRVNGLQQTDAAHVAAEVGKLSFARVPCCICWGELSLVPRLAIACIRARHQVEREGVRRGRVVVLEKVNVLCVLGDPVRGSVHHPRRCRPKSNRVARYATVTATATRSADPHIVRAAVIERMQHS